MTKNCGQDFVCEIIIPHMEREKSKVRKKKEGLRIVGKLEALG